MSLIPTNFLRDKLSQPVAILGDGISGRGAAQLAAALGGSASIYDARGEIFSAEKASRHALAIYSPGFSPAHPWLQLARAAGCACRSELDFAAPLWRGRIIAITGTNGKTTLTEFLTHALRVAGKAAFATGNIGHSFAGLVAERSGGASEELAICEVSSFQAEALEDFQADASLWTNFAEDHLERHADLRDYFRAKQNLFAHTLPGHRFADRSVGAVARDLGIDNFDSEIIETSTEPDSRLRGTVFEFQPQFENFLTAAAWWRSEGLSEEKLFQAAQTFVLGSHRLALVGVVNGVEYWNDSKATNFHAVEAALTRFPRPVLLIAGGKSKGGDLAAFVRRIARRVRHAFLIGETAEILGKLFGEAGVARTLCRDLAEAVRRAAALAHSGEQILLSPGFASFDQFQNYSDRGETFARLVQELSTKSPVSQPI